jgi:L-aspartate oxidase
MIYKRCLDFGFDLTRGPLPVVPAAHYCCGGAVTDTHGATEVDRLYVAGEAAMTGLHGANRLASNSLLEALVFGSRAAAHAIDLLGRDSTAPPALRPWNPGNAVDSDESVVVTQNWDEIRRLMWNYVGIVRTNRRLARAYQRMKMLQEEIQQYYWDFLVTADLIELRNIALVAQLIVHSAIRRRESRGLHCNLDYPETRTEWIRDTVLEESAPFELDEEFLTSLRRTGQS